MTETRTVTFEEFKRLIEAAGPKSPGAMRVAMQAAMQAMLLDVVKNRMRGQYLGIDTGKGWASIVTRMEDSGDVVRGIIGSPLRYIRAHEQGFKGPVQIPSHTRRLNLTRVVQKGKRAGERVKRTEKQRLQFSLSGRRTTTTVRAHTRQLNIRARRFLRDTVVQEAGGPFSRRVSKALKILLLFGRLPRTSELKVK